MDAEDLAEYRRLETRQEYSDVQGSDALVDLATGSVGGRAGPSTLSTGSSTSRGEAMMQRMGWKPGQGIGPLVSSVRRRELVHMLERMHLAPRGVYAAHDDEEAKKHKFPPPDTQPFRVCDADRPPPKLSTRANALDDALRHFHASRQSADSDDDDVYGAGVESTLSEKETLMLGAAQPQEAPKSDDLSRGGQAMPPGFVPAREAMLAAPMAPLPTVPADWQPDPSRVWTLHPLEQGKQPTKPSERGAMLGEAKHPGPPPVISAYLLEKAKARQQTNAPSEPTLTRLTIHALDGETARRALASFRPTGADPAKDARYRAYLQSFLGTATYQPPEDTLKGQQDEVDEFFQSASRHRPVHGEMANRFTSSTFLHEEKEGIEAPKEAELDAVPEAVLAARRGEFGPRTRAVEKFDPPRLLCKRMGVEYPHPEQPDGSDDEANADADADADANDTGAFSAPTALESDTPGIAFIPVSDELESAMERDMQEPRPSMDLFKAVFENESDDEPEPPVHKRIPKKKKRERAGPLTFSMDDEDVPVKRVVRK